MDIFTAVLIIELALLFTLAVVLSYLVYSKKNRLLSKDGREAVQKRVRSLKAAAFLSLVSLIFFLQAETAEILLELFPGRFSIDIWSFYRFSLSIHLFLLITALSLFTMVFLEVED